jgi:hypothetical protein
VSDQEHAGPEYPATTFPTAFADTISSLAYSPTTVKYFLARFEPDLRGSNSTKSQPFAQVVMPMDGFLAAFCFFENRIKRFLEEGHITQAKLDEFRKLVEAGA